MTSGVYKITCLGNKKIYVGSSINIKKRWKEHRGHLSRGTHSARYLQASYKKYGQESFVYEILETCDPIIVLEREQYYLDMLKPYDPKVGFNTCIVAGSNAGLVHNASSIAKMKVNQRKKRAKYIWKGEVRSLVEIAELEGVSYSMLIARVLSLDYDIEKAISEPLRKMVPKFEYKGVSMTLRDWSRELGVSHNRLYRWTKQGLTVEQCLEKFDTQDSFITLPSLCRKAGISATTVKSRIKKGMSLEEALKKPARKMDNSRRFANAS